MKLALLVFVVVGGLALVLGIRSHAQPIVGSSLAEAPAVSTDSDSPVPQAPSFAVEVVRPRTALPFFGLAPRAAYPIMGVDPDLGFDATSPGAEIDRAGLHHLELAAEGWDLEISTDATGRIDPESYLAFPVSFGNRGARLRCRPAADAEGHLHTTLGPDRLDGRFEFELAICENAHSGRSVGWPADPLIVRGHFELPHRAG